MIYDSFSDVGESRVWFASASDPFFGLFLVISEVGSQIYIANLEELGVKTVKIA